MTELPRFVDFVPNGFQSEIFAFCPFPFDFPSIFISHKQLRIDARTVEVGAPVEVGASGDAGAADGAYGIVFAYHIPLLDIYRMEVHVNRSQALAMVDDDGVAVHMKPVGFLAGEHDFSLCGAFDRGSLRDGNIETFMVARYRCTIVGAFHAERTGFSPVTGIAEKFRPELDAA